MLIEIGDIIVTDELFAEKFICDLSSCNGACCVDGDDGAPLTDKECLTIEKLLPKIKPYMTEEGIEKVGGEGVFHYKDNGAPVTNLLKNGACAFVCYDEKGSAKCSIETAYRDHAIDWKKPISCALFPIRAKKYKQFTALNYQQIGICEPGCILGEKLGVPLYKFLKEPIIRAYGETFYQQLEEVAEQMENETE